MKAAAKNAAVLAAALAFLALCGLTVGCPFKRVFGLPCPGCGMTRACLSLLRLDFAAAWRWNPLCFLVVPLAVMFVLKDTSAGKRFWNCTPLMAALTAACLACYVVRMIMLFPHTPPMDAEENSLIVKIIHKFLLQ